MTTNRPSLHSPLLRSALRIVAGLLFLEHGTSKFLSFPASRFAGSGGAFANASAYAGLIELITGLLIVLGLFTRPAAFLASGTMAVGYFLVHAPQNPWPINNMGDAAILFCFVFLYLAFAGPGPISVDELASGRLNDRAALFVDKA